MCGALRAEVEVCAPALVGEAEARPRVVPIIQRLKMTKLVIFFDAPSGIRCRSFAGFLAERGFLLPPQVNEVRRAHLRGIAVAQAPAGIGYGDTSSACLQLSPAGVTVALGTRESRTPRNGGEMILGRPARARRVARTQGEHPLSSQGREDGF
jgi:hypothetical protein